MTDDNPERFTDLDPVVMGRVNGLFEAATILDQKADFHDRQIDDTSNESHHRSCRNTANNLAHKVRRRAVSVVLEPTTSRYYYRDKERADDE